MARAERILAIDIGSTGLRIAEFSIGDGLTLHAYQSVEYDEHLSDSNRTLVISTALKQGLGEGNFSTKRAAVCVSGQAAFMRFVKLPPVSEEESRIRQIVEYEARQNVPFPIDEVIWDYQLIGSPEDEELEVMFVVIKNEIVEGVIAAMSSAGLKTILVDFAPAALYNVARAVQVGQSECSMVLNIGGRCSSLLFIEGGRFFVRTIPIAGYTITQQIAKEFGISADEAEILKRRHGFVALGGAYEEPESEVAATISKIIRNVMTRLHGEINRSINVYRTQQKGSKPTQLFLAGGSSTMAFTNEFFQDKLRMEVNYLNSFKIVSLGSGLAVEELQGIVHTFPETIGIALRYAVECPVEVSLVPDSIRKADEFGKRRAFLVAAAVVWIAILGVFYAVNQKRVQLYERTAQDRKDNVPRLTGIRTQVQSAQAVTKTSTDRYQSISAMLDQRYNWPEFLNLMQMARPTDVWLKAITPGSSGDAAPEAGPSSIFQASTAAGPTQLGVEQIDWFTLECLAVAIPDRRMFSEKQLDYFKEVKAGLAEAEPVEGQPELDFGWLPENAEDRRNIVTAEAGRITENYLAALRMMPEISAVETETRISSFDIGDKNRNLMTFTIQVRLLKPIPVMW